MNGFVASEVRIVNIPLRVATITTILQDTNSYAYHVVMRPPAIGTHPKGEIGTVEYQYQTYQANIGRCAWGMVIYNRPLTQKEVDDYELVPDDDTDCRYRQYAIERGSITLLEGEKRKVERKMLLADDGLIMNLFSEAKAKELCTELLAKETQTLSENVIVKYFVRKIAEHSDIARPSFRQLYNANPMKRAAGCS